MGLITRLSSVGALMVAAGCANDSSIVAMPEEAPAIPGVRVELTWDVGQSDLDLHLVHASAGGAYSSPLDCYFENPSPDWDDEGPLGDPSLDEDDVDGYGPEKVRVQDPSADAVYQVYVHYFLDRGAGAAPSTVRIFLKDVLVYEGTAVLSHTNQVWDVARINLATGEVANVGTLSDSP